MSNKAEIIKALDAMASIDIEVARLEQAKKEKIDSVLTPEIRKAIQDINDEFAPLSDAATKNRSAFEKTARDGCVELGESVTGSVLPGWQVVYYSGKNSWNMEKVLKRIEEDPTFKDLYEEGKPYTSLKRILPKPVKDK